MCRWGKCSRRTTITAAIHQSWFYGQVARLNPKACLMFAKKHLKDSQTERNKILWSDETKNCLNLIPNVMSKRKLGTAHHLPTNILTVQHNSYIMLWYFLPAGTVRFVRVEEKLNGAKNINILNENMFHSVQDLRLPSNMT